MLIRTRAQIIWTFFNRTRIPKSNRYGNTWSECWSFKIVNKVTGYGTFSGLGHKYAHRFSYDLFRGPIPDGLQIDHLCRNPRCVNPMHLEAVTHRENLMRSPVAPASLNAAKTACVHGHPLVGKNLRIKIAENRPSRVCRACEANRAARHRQATKTIRLHPMRETLW